MSALPVAPLTPLAAGLLAALAAAQPGALAGEWRCRSYAATTGILHTTRFTLRADGTYEAAGDRGRWSYDAASGRITWLEGKHTALYADTRTEVDRQGQRIIVSKIGKRTYRCLPAR